MPPSDPTASARRLYEDQVARTILDLREALVRHDENLCAWKLMSECVPYYLRGRLDIDLAREDQRLMVEHLLDPNVYDAYYAANPYERPFEEQYGGALTVETADRIPRVRWLADKLREFGGADGTQDSPPLPIRHLDLGSNDGWMGAHLMQRDDLNVTEVVGVDLAPDCVERAKARGVNAHVGRVEDGVADTFDAVSCFEVLEHVLDTSKVLEAIRDTLAPDGRAYLSTPHGATEQGDLPNWAFVEHKGHVRAWLPDDFTDAVTQAGLEPVELVIDPDGLMLMEARHA